MGRGEKLVTLEERGGEVAQNGADEAARAASGLAAQQRAADERRLRRPSGTTSRGVPGGPARQLTLSGGNGPSWRYAERPRAARWPEATRAVPYVGRPRAVVMGARRCAAAPETGVEELERRRPDPKRRRRHPWPRVTTAAAPSS